MTGFLTALFLKIPFPMHEYVIAASSMPIKIELNVVKKGLNMRCHHFMPRII